jgi:molecular chaperone GrpE (heat shock protein)
VDAQAQKERDQQARQILEAELAKATVAQAEIARLWNNGEPHKQGDEFKNPAKYQQRVAELRMALLRSEADMAGLRRELARLGTVVAKP